MPDGDPQNPLFADIWPDKIHSPPKAKGGAIDCLLREIYLGMSSAIGEEFFCYLLRYLARAVHADYGIISELGDGEETLLKTVAAYRDGGIVDNFEYEPAGTPCAEIARHGRQFISRRVGEDFRSYPFISGNLESYCGVPLVDYSGRTIGTMALIWSKPCPDDSLAESLLNIFALRVAAELERVQSIRALERQLHFLQVVVDAIPNPVFYKDTRYRYLGCNTEFENFFGIRRDELIGKSAFDIAPPDLAFQYNEKDLEVTEKEGILMYESSVARADGTRRDVIFRKAKFTDPDGVPGGIVGTVIDVTERRKAEQKAYHLANYDPLTGLPNRVLFRERLADSMKEAEREKRLVALLLLDMDYFKAVNETWGHAACNQVLQMMSVRLSQWSREGDLVARIGGDKFAIALSSIARSEDAALVSRRLLEMMSRPVKINGQEIHCSGSIGIAIYSDEGEDADILLKKADTAMYQAKKKGRGAFQFYSEAMDIDTKERLEMETGLRRAIQRHEFKLHYQPQVDLQSGRMVGVEALLRWQHPERGMIPPDDFIPTAEETSLILPIGEWVLHEACTRNKGWQDAGHPPLRIAVNISGVQLKQPVFIETVERILRATGLHPEWLELELTESIMMKDTEETLRILGRLKEMGVYLSIDDFGTGYSSLEYLKRFPIDKLKMDRSYVCGLPDGAHDVAIAEAILAMAGGLGLQVLAEGVETEEQVRFLKARNCHQSQGFYFSHPMSAEDLEKHFIHPPENRSIRR